MALFIICAIAFVCFIGLFFNDKSIQTKIDEQEFLMTEDKNNHCMSDFAPINCFLYRTFIFRITYLL